MIACVFSCVPLIIHRCCKKPTIIVVSFLFFSFHKDLSTARGALRLLLGSQILLFLFSLPANPPPPCLFFEADVNRCLQRAVYLSLPRLVLSSDPRVNAFQRSIILCFYGLPMEGWKEERERETYRDWEKVENNQTITTYARCCGSRCSIYKLRALTLYFLNERKRQNIFTRCIFDSLFCKFKIKFFIYCFIYEYLRISLPHSDVDVFGYSVYL